MGREGLVDAGLAAGALVVVVLAGAALEVRWQPVTLLVGGLGTLVLEVVLHQRAAAVRRAWASPGVKAATVGGFLVALGLAVAHAPAAGLALLAGGLVGYLVLLAGLTIGRRLVVQFGR